MNLLNKISKALRRTVSETAFVWIRELSTAFRDEGVLVFMVLVPLGYPLLYSYIYNNEVVKEIPVAVVDESNSPLSRQYIRHLDATESVLISQRPADLGEAQEMMRRCKVYGILLIPNDFSKNILTGKKAWVYTFTDASTLLYYRQISIANTEVSMAMNAEVKLSRSPGNTTDRQDELTTAPLKYEEVDIFNPEVGMATFLLPAVLMLILQQTTLLGVGINAGTMREKHAFRLFRPIAQHKGGLFEIVLGRSLCYILVYIANSFFVLGITPMLFHFNRLYHFPDLAAFMLPYLLAITFMAICVSYFIRERETCMMVILFSSVFFMFISGISWPWGSVPTFWKILGSLAPSTLGMNGFVRMTNEGARLSQVMPEYIGLWLLALLYFVLAMRVTWLDICRDRRAFNRAHRRRKRLYPQSIDEAKL